MAGREEESLAFQAARAQVFEGVEQRNSYTEPLLHRFRARRQGDRLMPLHVVNRQQLPS